MDANYNRFQERLRRIEGAAGADVTVRPDGLIVRRRRVRSRLRFPWHSMALAVTCCFLLKGAMIWHQGEAAYAARLSEMQGGDRGQQAAAWLLAVDPVSGAIGAALRETLGPPPR